jgi:hypothetical protein
MEHWSNEFEHSSITDENRESFNADMAKFPTKDDAVIGYRELQKTAGKPFKLPESLDKLPDDTTRAEFTSQANKILGIRRTKDIKELADVNLRDGHPDGVAYNEEFANSFKQFVVDNNLNVNAMPKYAKFFNEAMAGLRAKNEADKIAAAEKCNTALIAHPDIGSKEKLTEMTELFVRAMKNHVGLTAAEVEELADGLALSALTTNPVLARIMLKQFAPLATEGSSEAGGHGNQPPAKPPDPDEGSPTYDAMGWSTPEQVEEYNKRQKVKAPAK